MLAQGTKRTLYSSSLHSRQALTPLRISARDRYLVQFLCLGAKAGTENDDHPQSGTEVRMSSDGGQNYQDQPPQNEESVIADSSSLGWLSGVAAIGGVVVLSIVFKKEIQHLLQDFVTRVEGMGTLGYLSYAGIYILLETVAVPATPLTLAAGYLFGIVPGVCVVSVASTMAAILSFLISRYLLRQKVMEFFSNNKQFSAIDRAIEKDGFKFVFLLRLSPLFPFAASNYLYGLTSVGLGPYALASWIGMLPGTWAYISAGDVGRQVVDGAGTGLPPWEIGIGLIVTVVVLLLTGNLAKDALKEMEKEEL